MKKIVTSFSLIAMVGLGFIGYKNTKVDTLLGTEDKGEHSYIVEVAGNVIGTEEEKAIAEKNRKQVLSELSLKLGDDSYTVEYEYDTVFNGFAIKTTADKAEILKKTLNVSSVDQAHTYAAPDGTEEKFEIGSSTNGTPAENKAAKLANYSSETMESTKEDVESVTGSGSYKGGEGVTIGILDTGLYMNQVDGTDARTNLENNKNYSSKINAAAFVNLDSSVTKTLTKSVISKSGAQSGKYINDKIPFAYDYAGNDDDVDPTEKGSNHGTHVASLAGANGKDFQGIAPNSQIAVMKVFGDNDGGASTTAIIAAINDAAKLGLDTINMSLGTDLLEVGDSGDSIDNQTYKALKNATSKGVICNISAGNAGKSSFSNGDYGNYTTDIVEGGILGSDANFDETANIVASSTPEKAYYSSIMNVQADTASTSSSVSYSDQVKTSTTQTFDSDRPLTDLLGYEEATGLTEFVDGVTYYTRSGDADSGYTYKKVKTGTTFDSSVTYYTQKTSATADYITIGGYGTESDYNAVGKENVKGKVAVVKRGNTTFVDKTKQAEIAGASALIVINNSPTTTFNFSMDFNDYSPSIPVVFVFQNSTSAWSGGAANFGGQTGKLNLMVDSVATAGDGNSVSSFSSDGPSSNLDIGPSISAPGSSVIGAVNASASNSTETDSNATSDLYGYENMSGTSMAAPNLTGAIALALGQKKVNMTADEYAEEKKVISQKAMATADQLMDGTGSVENSPRMQGSGRINVKSLLTADSYVTVPNSDTDGFDNTIENKVELKNSGSLYVEGGDFTTSQESYIEFDYTIHNDSNTSKTYTPSVSVMIPHLEIKTTHEAYAAEEDSSKSQEVGYNKNVTFDSTDPDTYPTFVGTPTMSTQDDYVLTYSESTAKLDSSADKTITVAANGTATGKLKLRIDNLQFTKEWGDGDYMETFTGTLKEYFNKYFSSSAGSYVEGYLKLTETEESKSTMGNDGDGYETLTVPYLGFYGDYTVADAVEPFDFEKDSTLSSDGKKYNRSAHIYNSDLANSYLHNLNSNYAKPNAYTGSAINATLSSMTSDQINSIMNFNSSPVANGSDLLSVIGDGDLSKHLFAGNSHLNAFFYVNRTCKEATWSIVDASGNEVKTGNIVSYVEYSGTYTATTAYGLVKSWLTTSNSGTGYACDRGYADIDCSTVSEGEYTLKFNFTLNGAKDSKGDNVVQTKSYPLTVDKTAPTVSNIEVKDASTESSKRTKVTVTATGANNTIKIGSSNLVPEAVDGSNDTYTASATVRNITDDNDKVAITLTDYAHNSSVTLVHVNDLTFSVTSTFFTDKYDFTISSVDPKNNGYSIEIERNGNSVDSTKLGKFTLNFYIATGLNKDDISIQLDGEDASNFTYDSTTGLVTVTINKQSLLNVNYKPGKAASGDTSSSTSDSGSSSEEKKGGCGGSVIAASSTLAAIGLLAAGLALKKKREDK